MSEPQLTQYSLSSQPAGQSSPHSPDEDNDNKKPSSPVVENPGQADPPADKKTGRRKINIEFIEDKSRRHITFSKRKAGIMKKAYELSTLTGTQVLLLVASETGHVYTFATPKLQPLITKPEGKNLIQACLNAPDPPQSGATSGGGRISAAAAADPAGVSGLSYADHMPHAGDQYEDKSKEEHKFPGGSIDYGAYGYPYPMPPNPAMLARAGLQGYNMPSQMGYPPSASNYPASPMPGGYPSWAGGAYGGKGSGSPSLPGGMPMMPSSSSPPPGSMQHLGQK
jgi:hypothetical protein